MLSSPGNHRIGKEEQKHRKSTGWEAPPLPLRLPCSYIDSFVLVLQGSEGAKCWPASEPHSGPLGCKTPPRSEESQGFTMAE